MIGWSSAVVIGASSTFLISTVVRNTILKMRENHSINQTESLVKRYKQRLLIDDMETDIETFVF